MFIIRLGTVVVRGRIWILRSENDRIALREQFRDIIADLVANPMNIDRWSPFSYSDFNRMDTSCCVLLFAEPIREEFLKKIELTIKSLSKQEGAGIELIQEIGRLALYGWYKEHYGSVVATQALSEAIIEIVQ